MNSTKIHLKSIMFFAVIVALGNSDARAQSDDFRDGNDDGWTRFNPLAPFGASVGYSFPPGNLPFTDYQYRIQAGISPDPAAYGSARGGSFRLDVSPASIFIGWVVADWDNSINQSFGAMARASSIGFGTTDGYAFTYSTGGSINLLRIDNEIPTTLASTAITLDPAFDYLFGFRTMSGGYRGEVFKIGPDGLDAVASVGEVVDQRYSGGVAGLYVFSEVPNGRADATFDNFSVGIVPEPSTLSVLALAGVGGLWIVCRRRFHSR